MVMSGQRSYGARGRLGGVMGRRTQKVVGSGREWVRCQWNNRRRSLGLGRWLGLRMRGSGKNSSGNKWRGGGEWMRRRVGRRKEREQDSWGVQASVPCPPLYAHLLMTEFTFSVMACISIPFFLLHSLVLRQISWSNVIYFSLIIPLFEFHLY